MSLPGHPRHVCGYRNPTVPRSCAIAVPAAALQPSLRDLLSAISAMFAEGGMTPSQTATFVFSLKHVLSDLAPDDPAGRQTVHKVLDAMGLFSVDAFIQRREQIILA